MSKSRLYMRNAAANWLGYAANIVVMLLLSRLVVHSLGKTGYGVWSLLMTLTGYLGLAELGVRVSTGRYVNYYIGRGEQDKVDKVVSTSMVFCTLISLVVFAAALIIGTFFHELFPKTPASLADEAFAVLMMTALNVWLGFMGTLFGQLLRARNRFDLRSLAMVITLLVRAVGTWIVLKRGGGLVELAEVLVLSSGVSFLLFVAFTRWKGAPARIALSLFDWQTLKETFRYGIWAFMQNISSRIISCTDVVVIGLLLKIEDIAVYSIALSLIEYSTALVQQLFSVLVPDVEQAAGRDDKTALAGYMLNGTRVTLMLAVPLLVGLMTMGDDFIRIWLGPGFERSGGVLIILAVTSLAGMLSWSPGMCLNAMGYVKINAAISGSEAVLNLVLSLAFVTLFKWDIYGVAAGTMVPAIGFSCILVTRLCYRKLGVPFGSVLTELVFPMLVTAAVFAAICLGWQALLPVTSWGTFLLSLAVLATLYAPLGLYAFLPAELRKALWTRIMARLGFAADVQVGDVLPAQTEERE
ncbi:MAG: oligosaccharide flippase family protein [Planctomycetaceae bacterium]|nr:oligosaccharide flippase family protein [Planctomycetaceae bacterium]